MAAAGAAAAAVVAAVAVAAETDEDACFVDWSVGLSVGIYR